MSASTRAARSTRRQAAKRTILGAIDDNDAASDPSAASSASTTNKASSTAGALNNKSNSGSMALPVDLDGTSTEQIKALIQDLECEVQSRCDAIALKAEEAVHEQREVAFLGGIKLGRDTKKMTVKDFNAKFGCDVLAEVMKVVNLAEESGGGGDIGAGGAGKKRVRPGEVGVGSATASTSSAAGMALETPAVKKGTVSATPGTVRTVRRGEAVFSVNGSPVDHAEEGDLVATVAKKRKGDSGSGGSSAGVSAAFDINVGDGRYISLSDPTTVEHLDDDMKSTAMNQLKILQDQMASLMAQLGN